MVSLDLHIHDPRWHGLLGEDAKDVCLRVLRTAQAHVPEYGMFSPQQQAALGVNVALVDDVAITKLNAEFRRKNTPTNVLSFPMYETSAALHRALQGLPDELLSDMAIIGDVIMAYDTISREAEAQGKTIYDHFCHLLIHGWLHLWSYDHMNDAEATAMEAIEIAILRELSIANPYENNV